MQKNKLHLNKEQMLKQRGLKILYVAPGENGFFQLPLIDTTLPGQYIIRYNITIERVAEGTIEEQIKLAQVIKR